MQTTKYLPKHPERLLKLAALLRADAANPEGAQFDLSYWAAPSSKVGPYGNGGTWAASTLGLYDMISKSYATVKSELLPAMSCGTTACAMGLAMISKQFEEFGLTGSAYQRGDGSVVLVPSCGGETGFEAARLLFGIDENSAQYLFDPDHYRDTPREAEGEIFVAERIEDFVRGEIDADQHSGIINDDSEGDEGDED